MASVPLAARAGDVPADSDIAADDLLSDNSFVVRRKPKCWNLLAAAGLVVASLAMLLLLVSVLMPSASLANSAIVQQTQVPDVLNLHAKKPSAPLDVVFVLGGPGAGKGTQCDNIVRYFKWAHLSMGDLLRAEVQKGGKLASEISDAMKNGKLVPGEVTVELLKAEMGRQAEYAGITRFLIDGFPRNRENLDDWERAIGPVNPANSTIRAKPTVVHKKHGHLAAHPFATVQFALFFDLDEKTMLARCLHRGETSGRSDDNEESVKKRFVTYNNETKPILEALEDMGLVRTISSVPDEEHVFKKVRPLFEGTERRTPLPPPKTEGPVQRKKNDTTVHDTIRDHPTTDHPDHPTMMLFNAWVDLHYPDTIKHARTQHGCPAF